MRAIVWFLKLFPNFRRTLEEDEQVFKDLEEFFSPEARAERERDDRERLERLLTIPKRDQ